MGTRSLTHIHDNEGNVLTTIYRQYDGYPSGMGNDIKSVLGGKTVVNGYSDPEKQVNGMGCAAAMLIAGLKDGCGNVYVYPADSSDMGEDYIYILSTDGAKLLLEVQGAWEGNVLYSGPLDEFDGEAVENAENED